MARIHVVVAPDSCDAGVGTPLREVLVAGASCCRASLVGKTVNGGAQPGLQFSGVAEFGA